MMKMQFLGAAALMLATLVTGQTEIDPSNAIRFRATCKWKEITIPCKSIVEQKEKDSVAGGFISASSSTVINGFETISLDPILFLPTPPPSRAPSTPPPTTSSPTGAPIGSTTRSPLPVSNTFAPTRSPSFAPSTTKPTTSPSQSTTRSPTASPVVPPRCTIGQCAQCSETAFFNSDTSEVVSGCGFVTSNETAINDLANVTAGGCVLSFVVVADIEDPADGTLLRDQNITLCLDDPVACGVSDESGNITAYNQSTCPIDEVPEECGDNTGVIIIIIICVLLLLIVIFVGIYYVVWTTNNHKGPSKVEVN